MNFAVNMGIGFAITPFIVSRVGAEAYGFAGLANTMVGYATLFTIALNSVAGRFITVAYHQGGGKRRADVYFSSTLAMVLLLIGTLILSPINRVITDDVKSLIPLFDGSNMSGEKNHEA